MDILSRLSIVNDLGHDIEHPNLAERGQIADSFDRRPISRLVGKLQATSL